MRGKKERKKERRKQGGKDRSSYWSEGLKKKSGKKRGEKSEGEKSEGKALGIMARLRHLKTLFLFL